LPGRFLFTDLYPAGPPNDIAGNSTSVARDCSMSDTATREAAPEAHPFQAEVARLLGLMVHSVYSDRDVFLRELISNAADALDKLRYEAIARPELIAGDPVLKIAVGSDKAARTLTITDNGIGMSRQELIDNLGTIAKSGTRAFVEKTTAAEGNLRLIGQFGIGFYSAFMVADRVDVLSRKAGENEAGKWSSDGTGSFTVESLSGENAPGRGTKIVLHLKEDALEFLEPSKIESVVRAYSDHIAHPIMLGRPRNRAPDQQRQRDLDAAQDGGHG
jgi:molecular chaperone HtpG